MLLELPAKAPAIVTLAAPRNPRRLTEEISAIAILLRRALGKIHIHGTESSDYIDSFPPAAVSGNSTARCNKAKKQGKGTNRTKGSQKINPQNMYAAWLFGYNPRPAWLSFPQKPLSLGIFQGTVENWQPEIRGCGFPRGDIGLF
jgi:hypothetical protein